jgi:hypothetical protein
MVRLMSPAYVKPYIKRQKNDAADATARKERSGNLANCARGGQAHAPLFDIERDINGLSAEERLRVRKEQSGSLLELWKWLREEDSRLSRSGFLMRDYYLRHL